jgi:hypothetical protein
MNERIQQLAEQAGFDDRGSNHTAYMNFDHEKFAELIVRECAEHCKGEMMDKKTAEWAGLNYNDGVMDCAVGLLQHFGVE